MDCVDLSCAMPIASPTRVLILGAGFGGLSACRALANERLSICIVDRRNHHLFQPLLYQVATAGLNPSDIAYPIRHILRRQKNVRVLLGDAVDINLDKRRVRLDDESTLDYDYLVVATGATHSYFGHSEWLPHAPGLKTIEDALEIRRRVLLAFEAAEREEDPEARQAWMTFVVVGGGPTGVELAGALSEIARDTVARDFRAIDPKLARVILVEGEGRVLPSYPEELSAKAKDQLEKLGVEVRLGERVTEIRVDCVEIAGTPIAARTTLWAAGVEASPVAKTLGVALDRAGRVLVSGDLSLPSHPEVFVIGDLAAAPAANGTVPGVAPAAMQGGKHAAECISDSLHGDPRPEFRYKDKGSLATIGRAAAVADFGKLRFSGFFAWVAWWSIHILFLIGFRSKVLVMFGWIWSYLTFQRGARLITGTSGSPAQSLRKLSEGKAPLLLPQRAPEAEEQQPRSVSEHENQL